jgi:hypothetical protein
MGNVCGREERSLDILLTRLQKLEETMTQDPNDNTNNNNKSTAKVEINSVVEEGSESEPGDGFSPIMKPKYIKSLTTQNQKIDEVDWSILYSIVPKARKDLSFIDKLRLKEVNSPPVFTSSRLWKKGIFMWLAGLLRAGMPMSELKNSIITKGLGSSQEGRKITAIFSSSTQQDLVETMCTVENQLQCFSKNLLSQYERSLHSVLREKGVTPMSFVQDLMIIFSREQELLINGTRPDVSQVELCMRTIRLQSTVLMHVRTELVSEYSLEGISSAIANLGVSDPEVYQENGQICNKKPLVNTQTLLGILENQNIKAIVTGKTYYGGGVEEDSEIEQGEGFLATNQSLTSTTNNNNHQSRPRAASEGGGGGEEASATAGKPAWWRTPCAAGGNCSRLGKCPFYHNKQQKEMIIRRMGFDPIERLAKTKTDATKDSNSKEN